MSSSHGSSRIVVALGGNALIADEKTGASKDIGQLCAALAREADKGLVITHGNGPQLGYLDELQAGEPRPRPLDVLDAETEGWLGYEIQLAMQNALDNHKQVVSLLTCIGVDRDDPAMSKADKPVGPWYDAAQAHKFKKELGWNFIRKDENNNQGEKYRRVVPSPEPVYCLQGASISSLLEAGAVVICAGGGGIPVASDADGHLQGVEAVIDKDKSSALIARELHASLLVLATNVKGVYRQWPPETGDEPLAAVQTRQLRDLDLEAGSMAPKVQAAINFVEQTAGTAVIGHIDDLQALLECRAGTIIQ